MELQSLTRLINKYKREESNLRFGQWFCNNYIKNSWPALYHEANYAKCKDLIKEYLLSNSYITNLPPETNNEK